MFTSLGNPLDFIFDNGTFETEFKKDLYLLSIGPQEIANMVVDVESRKLAATTRVRLQYEVRERELSTLDFS